MRKTSTAMDLGQEEANPWRESLEQRLRERMRELIEQVLEEEVEEALGAPRSQRAATRSGYRHGDRKSTRLNSSHGSTSYAVFYLKKKSSRHKYALNRTDIEEGRVLNA